jgi:hypothetical protein
MIRSPMRTSIGATGGVFVGVLLGLFKPALGWIDLSTITDFRLALSGIFIANLPALFQRDRLPDAIENQFSTVSRAVKSGKLSRAQAKFYYAQIVTTALEHAKLSTAMEREVDLLTSEATAPERPRRSRNRATPTS